MPSTPRSPSSPDAIAGERLGAPAGVVGEQPLGGVAAQRLGQELVVGGEPHPTVPSTAARTFDETSPLRADVSPTVLRRWASSNDIHTSRARSRTDARRSRGDGLRRRRSEEGHLASSRLGEQTPARHEPLEVGDGPGRTARGAPPWPPPHPRRAGRVAERHSRAQASRPRAPASSITASRERATAYTVGSDTPRCRQMARIDRASHPPSSSSAVAASMTSSRTTSGTPRRRRGSTPPPPSRSAHCRRALILDRCHDSLPPPAGQPWSRRARTLTQLRCRCRQSIEHRRRGANARAAG